MLKTTIPILLFSGLISCTNAGESITLDPAQICLDNNRSELAQCNNEFNDPENPNFFNQQAFESCTDGAQAALLACLAGTPNTEDNRNQFLDDIRQCMRDWPDGGSGFDHCLAAALTVYRFRLGLPPEDPCGLTSVGTSRVAPIDTIYTAALDLGALDGQYPVQVESTLSFQAGVSATNSYNLAGRPCIKEAELIAIYDTKTGLQSVALDADTNTADGTYFDLPIFANRVIDANNIYILAIYYDAQSNPVFIEYANLSITQSPIQGDWNRDEILNSQDIIDFLASYDAQTKRADINGDTQVTPADATLFVNP